MPTVSDSFLPCLLAALALLAAGCGVLGALLAKARGAASESLRRLDAERQQFERGRESDARHHKTIIEENMRLRQLARDLSGEASYAAARCWRDVAQNARMEAMLLRCQNKRLRWIIAGGKAEEECSGR